MYKFIRSKWNLLAISTLFVSFLTAQTTIYSENFNGVSNTFTLNTAEASSTGSGQNLWVVNNVYAGGSGTISCLGLDLPYTIANTANQPGAITGSPNSNYLHTLSQGAQSDGNLSCSYLAVDGFCNTTDEKIFARTGDISTSGFNNVSLSFYWLCAGGTNIYGEVLYSTDGGSNWTAITTPIAQYKGQTNWQQQNISLPAFNNQASIRFGFRFNNSQSSAAEDPGFGIDDVVLINTTGSETPTITTTFSAAPSYCTGAQIPVPFTSVGTFTGANMYKAQLSDASGSFSSPTEIGSLASTANSGSITATIPVSTPSGSAYRIRIVSTSPEVTGTTNANDFAVVSADQILVTRDPAGANNLCGGSVTLSISNSYTGIQWSPGGQTTNSIVVTAAGDYSVSANGSGGCQAQSEVISLAGAEGPHADFTYVQPSGYLIEFTNTSEGGTSYFWNFGAATTTSVNPTFTFPFDGEYPVKLIATNECGSDTVTITVIVRKFVGINELLAKASLNIHPVPVTDVLILDFVSPVQEDAIIAIVNITGQEVYKEVCRIGGTFSRTIPTGQLSSGIYLLKVYSASGSVTSKFIKN